MMRGVAHVRHVRGDLAHCVVASFSKIRNGGRCAGCRHCVATAIFDALAALGRTSPCARGRLNDASRVAKTKRRSPLRAMRRGSLGRCPARRAADA
ncbi:hypothetical protein [Burkholderia pseudomallei]|uniref:Uncharacterized protein n=3 Tax=Burkholderia pseudomallei TaxID=28450 RepID=A0AAX0U6N9_BURPE|nr:hypothetical protein [Burkholderia pseudomallei]ABN95302.1 hypothetical protein BURPS1106A_A0113 [Burkholderia pseudomallei 1106a]EES23376.1 hypothetical protein BURPS1106B_1876 [Burkholderia pseudomallei 1106b]EET04360.1 conserved hypothetical protein [Burkholderia pseudomallei 1710a]AYX05130.1 hypothetical protein EGY14_01840 [Burkholderia pseudomallei]AYX33670.1 hypothetical protein EGY16_34565 [Burkholderia pseudomallei]